MEVVGATLDGLHLEFNAAELDRVTSEETIILVVKSRLRVANNNEHVLR